jgi:transposase
VGLVFYRYLLWKLKKQNELLSETRIIEELEKIRVALVKRDDNRPNFVFEKMDLDQMRLFTELRLDTVLKETKVTV